MKVLFRVKFGLAGILLFGQQMRVLMAEYANVLLLKSCQLFLIKIDVFLGIICPSIYFRLLHRSFPAKNKGAALLRQPLDVYFCWVLINGATNNLLLHQN